MVPLEAMSYGLPVISSDATSLPEAIKHRVTGYLFKVSLHQILQMCWINLI
ncbi:glycosyltransferase [Klebsiella pneumoniae]|uniref:Glycosyltransferase n=1 Tax=Klebsiella pneumoniae TaxID=573 RepID=A0A927DAW8_KLEPN|nr:glycosyltransferase [Klebsiella pneumoniae]